MIRASHVTRDDLRAQALGQLIAHQHNPAPDDDSTPQEARTSKVLDLHQNGLGLEARKRGPKEDLVVVLNLTYVAGNNGTATSLRITPAARAFVKAQRAAGLQATCPTLGTSTRLPFTVETCLEYINSFIRNDETNALLLRISMKPCDVQAILDAIAKQDNFASRAYRRKYNRESIYQSMLSLMTRRRV
ncbi:hypothetical protein R3P38DRAFT_3581626 [Favolaschia claudopus]|uniref:DUF8205 domain-containing protein n=1 Tax=Favolaschia claudopus TaxID=2862362 RepID=A0AAW0ALR7_9AGAR